MIPARAITSDYQERFRRSIARNAAGWLAFLKKHEHDPTALAQELPNLMRAVSQALLEPQAVAAGIDLIVALWPLVERYGHWLSWQRALLTASTLCQRIAKSNRFSAVSEIGPGWPESSTTRGSFWPPWDDRPRPRWLTKRRPLCTWPTRTRSWQPAHCTAACAFDDQKFSILGPDSCHQGVFLPIYRCNHGADASLSGLMSAV